MDQSPKGSRNDKRFKLQTKLETILGSRNVYFQPQETVRLTYPCIVYSRNSPRDSFANNDRYLSKDRYTITIIDRDPDSTIPDRVLDLPMSSLDRTFIADSLNHTAVEIYI